MPCWLDDACNGRWAEHLKETKLNLNLKNNVDTSNPIDATTNELNLPNMDDNKLHSTNRSTEGRKSYYQKKDVDNDQNHVVKIASEISNNDKNWILTLEAENGLWDMYRKHPRQNNDGSWDFSCGLNSYYHKDMIKRIKDKTASETEILQYCYNTYNQRKTAFYGYKKRMANVDKFYLTQT